VQPSVFSRSGSPSGRGDDCLAECAREGHNPCTGERIAIGPSSGVTFKPGKALKEALN